ncbi:NHLP leader peptide family RiPP precursor [Paenibacillus pini]|uniref:Nitrile hydratase alpha/Thiocyanate hydrolase gamma domain-containing protein n=1 Tax=Paenibacillus pini JCM 16418 TaxID=1236976 RepID=W7YM04_9BACL|nr:NHLP leader peptide family RiPP precursor [Paenibacillus pini]GAF08583.1 hypothetical protein JCM16418_2667 [Paenibacillus pini JCM 16418]
MSTEVLFQNQLVQLAWQDPSFKERLMRDPKSAIKEAFGIIIPEHIKLKTVEESAHEFYLVIPPSPADVSTIDPSTKATW